MRAPTVGRALGMVLAGVLLANGLGASDAAVPPPDVANVASRRHLTMNGDWRTIVDPYGNGQVDYRAQPRGDGGFFKDARPKSPSDLVEYDFDTSPVLKVPGDWNTQRPELLYYEGPLWYRRRFEASPEPGRRYLLHFEAANHAAKVAVNGEVVGTHEGGFTPFAFDVTAKLRAGTNSVVVLVDNTRRREAVPTLMTDWWNYGGLTRPVRLLDLPETFVRDYHVQLARGSKRTVSAWVSLDGPRAVQDVVVRIPEARVEQRVRTGADGRAQFQFDANVELWSPEKPRLYDVEIAAETDRVTERIGFRTIEVRGTDILLNGAPIFLRGVCAHEEAPFRGGRAWSVEDARTQLGWVKELGGNFVRLAHYPHNETIVREADRLGVLVWAEIPVYWTIDWSDPRPLASARQQLAELIGRDRNRAAVVLWSIANETPISEPRNAFLRTLIDDARRLDPTRLLTAALQARGEGDTHVIDDPIGEQLDVMGNNEYIGWYDGTPEKCDRVTFRSPWTKPLVMSEFGADALAGHRGAPEQRFTEDYQEVVYQRQIAMLKRIPFLRGTAPWILMDFRSPRRPLPVIQEGWNRKGVVSERGLRKRAFYVLQAFYEELAGKALPRFVPKDYTGKPFGDDRHPAQPQRIPGRLQCELYDRGGPEVAYHDSDGKNSGSGGLNPIDGGYLNGFRADEAVDISYTKDKGNPPPDFNPFNRVTPEPGSLYVGWTEAGEWVNYTVRVEETGVYSIDVLYTSNGEGRFELSVDGTPRGTVTLPTTHDDADPEAFRQWHHWNRLGSVLDLDLKAGVHLVRIALRAGNTNLDYLHFRRK